MPTPDKPEAVVLAGPNGAGKTTVSPKFLGPDIEFVNADIIGAELRRANPDLKGADFTAGRIVSCSRDELDCVGERTVRLESSMIVTIQPSDGGERSSVALVGLRARRREAFAIARR